MTSPVRVFLLHSYRTFADSLVAVCAQRPGEIVIVDQATEPQEAIRRLVDLEVDVVLFENDLDRAPRRPRIRRLLQVIPELRIVPMDVDDPKEILQILEAGGAGWVPHDMPLKRLVAHLDQIRQGRSVCPPEIAFRVLERIGELSGGTGEDSAHPPPTRELTSRELEILEQMHRSNKEIATELDLSQATVKSHVHSILSKMGVSNRTLARTRARVLGLVPEEQTES